MIERQKITVETLVNEPIDVVWEAWTNPEHITKWSFASDDWQSPTATNDLKVGGTFSTRMEPKADPAGGFDIGGTYTKIEENALIEYTMNGEDKREVTIKFESVGENTKITETFDSETENAIELQKGGWQSIMDNFKKHVESL